MDSSNISDLEDTLEQYEAQLSQVKLAASLSAPGSDRDGLISLQHDIEEVIRLTEENISSLQTTQPTEGTRQAPEDDAFSKEYALFKAEMEELDSANPNVSDAPEIAESSGSLTPADIQDELSALQGSKCQAPHSLKWGETSYHNALVASVEMPLQATTMDQIKVRVLYTNPTHREMIPCPYYLEGDCRFDDENCHFSHGEEIPVGELREYKAPDFSSLRAGSIVLAKQKDLWQRAVVQEVLVGDMCQVKFEAGSSGGASALADLHLHHLLPLLGAQPDGGETLISGDDDGSDTSESDSERESEYEIVEHNLLRQPASVMLGAWEKHTKGIGSRLMARMGYVLGSGLGSKGEGRLEPVQALIYPPGKSLDHCMALREAAGDNQDMFKAERKHRIQQHLATKRRAKEYEKEKQRTDLFSFINSKLAGPSGLSNGEKLEAERKRLSGSSGHGLNVEGLRVSEEVRRAERDLATLQGSLGRQEAGSAVHKTISGKLDAAKSQLDKLQALQANIAQEQSHRQAKKKMTVF